MHTRNGKPPASLIVIALVGGLLLVCRSAAAQTTVASEIRRLEEQMRQMQEEYQHRIRNLEQRITILEAEAKTEEKTRDKAELEEILSTAEGLTREQVAAEEEAERQRKTFVGRERTLQALNPEISFLGDFSYDWADGPVKDGFLTRGVEIAFQAPLDPYTRFKGFLAGHEEPFGLPPRPEGPNGIAEDAHAPEGEVSVNVEEAYMEWVALPGNTRLRVGKFRQQFGTLNRWHPHALPSADVPFALRNAFGHEGLVGLGIGADWQLPGIWATSNSLSVEITNADNPSAFAGSDWNDPSYLIRHTGFFEFGLDAYFDLGLNWIRGPNGADGDLVTTLGGVDFAYVWEPVSRAKYRNVEIRGEYIRGRFETEDSGAVFSDSWYAYASSKLNRRWTVGFRYDDAELPWDRFELFDPVEFRGGLRERAWTPFVTWSQSEFVRLRLQYQHASRDFVFAGGDDSDDRVWLQVTFSAGPHKHESY